VRGSAAAPDITVAGAETVDQVVDVLALSCAVRYQEFLDGIEPDERIYHRGDPVAVIRAAIRG
jgi:hypothetical protein